MEERKHLTQNTAINPGGFFVNAELCTDAQELKVSGHPKTPRFPETPSQLPLKSVSFVLKAGSTYARNQVGKTGC